MMDSARFHSLARLLTVVAGRRVVVRTGLGVSTAGFTIPVAADDVATARKKRGKKKRKKGKGRCTPDCAGKACGPNGCGGSCGACAASEACLAGACETVCDVCASGCLFSNVAAAVNQVAVGSTLILCPETFQGTVIVDRNLTIVGGGADATETVLDGAGGNSVLIVGANRTVTVRNLTITGAATGSFGGVNNGGTLTLEAVRVVDNTAGELGGGIFNNFQATLSLVDTLVAGNEAGTSGGGIHSDAGTVTLVRSEVEGNESEAGGGIFNSSGVVNLTENSRVTRNTATGSEGLFGGGILNTGTVAVSGGSTVAGNTPDQCVDSGPGTGCP